ncbi:uncharacterized protein ACN427_008661 [Glossina fuscipes fuscipes]
MASKPSWHAGPGDNGSRVEKPTLVNEIVTKPFHHVNHKCTATSGCTIANQEAKINILFSQDEETLRDQKEKLDKWIEESRNKLKELQVRQMARKLSWHAGPGDNGSRVKKPTLDNEIEAKFKILSSQAEETFDKEIEVIGNKLKKLTKHSNALKRAMKQSKINFECAQNALQKVQDTLAIAGVALVDKDYDLKSEKFLKEGCDDMASTIGKGTDEAAGKDKKEMLI